jgi:hypothetical protein
MLNAACKLKILADNFICSLRPGRQGTREGDDKKYPADYFHTRRYCANLAQGKNLIFSIAIVSRSARSDNANVTISTPPRPPRETNATIYSFVNVFIDRSIPGNHASPPLNALLFRFARVFRNRYFKMPIGGKNDQRQHGGQQRLVIVVNAVMIAEVGS